MHTFWQPVSVQALYKRGKTSFFIYQKILLPLLCSFLHFHLRFSYNRFLNKAQFFLVPYFNREMKPVNRMRQCDNSLRNATTNVRRLSTSITRALLHSEAECARFYDLKLFASPTVPHNTFLVST